MCVHVYKTRTTVCVLHACELNGTCLHVHFSPLSSLSPPPPPPPPQLVTRAVRVIDLITNLDMSAFHSLGGWDKMLDRLELEVAQCRNEIPNILPTTVSRTSAETADEASANKDRTTSDAVAMETTRGEGGADATPPAIAMDTSRDMGASVSTGMADHAPSLLASSSKPCSSGVLYTCMPERAALIKSILNFLKKAIPEHTFSENMRTCE